MSISNARAVYGMTASAEATRTSVAGASTIGIPQSAIIFPDCDIAYSFKVTSTGAGDVATLTFATGVVAQTSGTPTITDGDGNDFEGKTLPTIVTVFGIMITTPASNADEIAIDTPLGGNYSTLLRQASVNQVQLIASADGIIGLSTTLRMTIASDAGDSLIVTIFGKST